jgi:V/A-type H+/Na+-transporting ATPase subunit K
MRRILLVLLAAVFLMTLAAMFAAPVSAQTTSTTAVNPNAGNKFIAAGVAFGLAALGAGIGVGTSGSAAIAAVTEKAEVRTTALIFVVLAEAIAIYGFAIAFIILGQPT